MTMPLEPRCPVLFTAMFDDAALFPPGNASMPDAVRRHQEDQGSWYANSMGAFVCPDTRVAELANTLRVAGIDQLDVALTVPGGPRTLAAAFDTARAAPRVRVVAVEVPLGSAPAAYVRDALEANDPSIAGYVEVPLAQLDTSVAVQVRTHGLHLKVRTGGTTAAAFPTEQDLARALTIAIEQRLAIKCTAGLHHAVRHRDPATGYEHHGFLNVTLAVHAALTTGDAGTTRTVLATQEPMKVASSVRSLTAPQVAAIRGVFRSFGTCSIDEPLADLAALDLLGVAP